MERRKPYTHESRNVGDGRREDAETEHREVARGSSAAPNEIDLEERNRPKAHGRRTHLDTRIDPDPLEEEQG